jgi:hypothetical protein
VIARRVQEVQDELLQRKGLQVRHVIMTSDEKDSAWWDEVKALGWFSIDHSKTSETFNEWCAPSTVSIIDNGVTMVRYRYPVFIDAVIQSNGEGFVGTDKSTMSVLAKRRVESWRDGAARIFKWGWLGADDH